MGPFSKRIRVKFRVEKMGGGHNPIVLERGTAPSVAHTEAPCRESIHKPSACIANAGCSASCWTHTDRQRHPATLLCSYSCYSAKKSGFVAAASVTIRKCMSEGRFKPTTSTNNSQWRAFIHIHTLSRRSKSRAYRPVLIAHGLQT